MTARERAAALYRRLDNLGLVLEGRDESAIFETITAAEADAYERAAKEAESTPVSWSDQAETAEAAAARIRALATKETP